MYVYIYIYVYVYFKIERNRYNYVYFKIEINRFKLFNSYKNTVPGNLYFSNYILPYFKMLTSEQYLLGLPL